MRLPSGSADGRHVVMLKRSFPVGEFLLYYYDSGCAPTTGDLGYFDQPSIVPPAAAYAGRLLLYGGGASFDMTVSEIR